MSATAVNVPPVAHEPRVLASVRGSLQNLAPARTRAWCPIAVPRGALLDASECVFVSDRGLRFRAVLHEHVGEHSTIYRVFAPFAEGQRIDGSLVAYDPADYREEPFAIEPFAMHPWVKDAPAKLIPRVRLRLRGEDYTQAKWLRLAPELETPAAVRWHGHAKLLHHDGRESGFVIECWTTFAHRSPVADVRLAIVWSDRTTPLHDLQIDGLHLITGEFCKLDFNLRNVGLADPVRNADGDWVNAVAGPLGFVDGSFLPLVGRMLCLPDQEVGDELGDTDEDLEALRAAYFAPCYGLADGSAWDGKFLANKNLAKLGQPRELVELIADQRLDALMATLAQPASWYAPRPFGIGKNPGMTGDQQDFGATKGWEALVAGDARWLHLGLYSVVADAFRGVAHYERDGSRLQAAQHPGWWTWSGYTQSNADDKLGKPGVPWGARVASVFAGYDDEHRSQNCFAAVYALTGDPLARFLVEHYSTTDIANVRFKRNMGIGATRAFARTMHTFANFALLSTGETRARYLALLADGVRQFKRDALLFRTTGPVKIIGARNDPRIGVTRNGVSVDAWNWEHGLAVIHLYAAWRVSRDPALLDAVKQIARTIVRYGTFQEAGAWHICDAVAWLPNGEPLPESDYRLDSTLVVVTRSGVATWVLPAVLVFIETHAADDPDMARARAIATAFGADRPAVDTRVAEWWACVRNVPAVPVAEGVQ